MNKINLFSKEWCELVFAGKNKEYGAYRIRMESSERHIMAMIIVFLSVAVLIFVYGFFSKSKAENLVKHTEFIDAYILSNLKQKPEDVEIPVYIETPPPVPIIESIKYLELVIAPDAEVTEADMAPAQSVLSESDAVIASVTHEGNTNGPGMLITDIEEVAPSAPVVTDAIVSHVEQMPVFPGGDAELMSFLKSNLSYPVVDLETGTHGTVTVRFVVNKDGSIGNIEILRSLSPGCDKEAIRVVKKMPDWIPGKQNGNPVRVYYTLPVRFRLSN